MKAFVVLMVLLAVCALSQAVTQNTQISTTCSVSAFTNVVDAYANDTFNFVNEAGESWEKAVKEGAKCAQDLDDYSCLVSCTSSAVKDFINTLLPSVQSYIVSLIEDTEALADDIYNCVN